MYVFNVHCGLLFTINHWFRYKRNPDCCEQNRKDFVWHTSDPIVIRSMQLHLVDFRRNQSTVQCWRLTGILSKFNCRHLDVKCATTFICTWRITFSFFYQFVDQLASARSHRLARFLWYRSVQLSKSEFSTCSEDRHPRSFSYAGIISM